MIPWQMGKQLVWDVMVVDALAPSRLNQSSLCNPGTNATDAETRKIEEYRELIDNGYIFQPVALEVQGSLGESSKILGGCKQVEFFWSKGQMSNLLIELQGSNGMRSNFIVFVVWLCCFAPFASSNIEAWPYGTSLRFASLLHSRH